MKTTLLKIGLTFLVLILLSFLVFGVFKLVEGNYFHTAGYITSVIIVLVIAGFIFLFYSLIRKIWMLALIVLIGYSCNYAKSNQKVLVSGDCGMTWRAINSGDAVPKGIGNPCFMKVVIPNFPMQGESKFITNLKGQVRASVHIDYDYSITEPLAFIKQAKYLGKANKDADDNDALSPDAFEGAENMVIDKRIKDVSKSLFLTEDIVDIDQADMENTLLDRANKVLEPFGVKLNFITLTFDLDEQTRQAIDISTAMKIYESKGLSDIGKSVMTARAGATKIIIENKTTPTNE